MNSSQIRCEAFWRFHRLLGTLYSAAPDSLNLTHHPKRGYAPFSPVLWVSAGCPATLSANRLRFGRNCSKILQIGITGVEGRKSSLHSPLGYRWGGMFGQTVGAEQDGTSFEVRYSGRTSATDERSWKSLPCASVARTTFRGSVGGIPYKHGSSKQTTEPS